MKYLIIILLLLTVVGCSRRDISIKPTEGTIIRLQTEQWRNGQTMPVKTVATVSFSLNVVTKSTMRFYVSDTCKIGQVLKFY